MVPSKNPKLALQANKIYTEINKIETFLRGKKTNK